MNLENDPAAVARLVGPGVVGLGVGTFVGLVATGSRPVSAVLAVVGAVTGHSGGYYVVRES